MPAQYLFLLNYFPPFYMVLVGSKYVHGSLHYILLYPMTNLSTNMGYMHTNHVLAKEFSELMIRGCVHVFL